MPISEQEALEAARHLLRRERRSLAYPVSDAPARHRLIPDPESPRWEFYFEYQPPAAVMVDPTCVRVFVDSITGAARLFSPHDTVA
jgi:hypothetical protein